MGITVIAVGKLKERFWKDAVAKYSKRLGGYTKLRIIEIPDKGIDFESDEIIRAAGDAYLILLAIEGKQRSSEGISQRLEELMTRGTSDIAFCIGGSDGVNESVYGRADETLSFGQITLPHNLARVVLLEQVYRAFKIMRGEPSPSSSFLESAQASLDEDVYGAANAWPIIPLREFGAGDRVASAHLEEPDGTHDHRVDASRRRICLRIGILPGKRHHGRKEAGLAHHTRKLLFGAYAFTVTGLFVHGTSRVLT